MSKILLLGKAHSGKGEIAKRLVEKYDYTEVQFSGPIKDAVVEMVNVFLTKIGRRPDFTREQLDRDKTKLRPLLTSVGQRLGREYFGPQTLWIDLLIEDCRAIAHNRYNASLNVNNAKAAKIVVSDGRLPNEAAQLRKHGFLVVKVTRDEEERKDSLFAQIFQGICDENGIGGGLALDDNLYEEAERRLEEQLAHPTETLVDTVETDVTVANTSLEELDRIAERLATGWTTPIEKTERELKIERELRFIVNGLRKHAAKNPATDGWIGPVWLAAERALEEVT